MEEESRRQMFEVDSVSRWRKRAEGRSLKSIVSVDGGREQKTDV
jgi:hypothetical protein